MADNTPILNASGGTETIADDDIAAGVAAGAKVQRVKVGFGVDGSYSDVAAGSALPVDGSAVTQPVSGSVNVGNFPATQPVSIAATVAVDTELPAAAALADAAANPTTTGAAAYAYSWNGTTWDRVKSATAVAGTTGTGLRAAGVLGFDGTNYQRVKTDTTGIVQVAQNGTVTVDTELPAAGALGDSLANPTAPIAGAANLLYNGTQWERLRNINTASAGTGGTGVLAAGVVGWDASSSVYRTLHIDNQGNLYVNPTGTASVNVTNASLPVVLTAGSGSGGWTPYSATALSSTKAVIKSTAGLFGGYMIYNPSAAVTYVQVYDTNGTVTVGTTAPNYVLGIPPPGRANLAQ